MGEVKADIVERATRLLNGERWNDDLGKIFEAKGLMQDLIDEVQRLRSSPSTWADGIEQAAKVADAQAAECEAKAQQYVRSKYIYAEHAVARKAAEAIAKAIRSLVPSPPSAWRDGEGKEQRDE